MPTADTNRVSLYYSVETAWNEPVATPTMFELPFVSDTIGHKKMTVVPTTIRPDRTQEAIVRVGDEASGDINFEFRHTIYDELIACTLGASITTIASTPTDLAITAPNQMETAGAVNFVTIGIVPGMNLRLSGRTNPANNGIFRVNTVSSTTVVFVTPTPNMVTEAAATTGIGARMVRNGVEKRSILLEKRWNDISQFEGFSGMRLGQMNMQLTSRQLVTGSFSLLGAQGPIQTTTRAASSVIAPTRPVYDASNNVAEIREAGTPFLTPVTSLQLTLLANLRSKPAVANRLPIDIGLGTMEVTGQLEAYFENITVWQKFYDHTATSLFFRLTDAGSRSTMVTIPSLYIAEGDIPTQGQNQDVFIPLPFRAGFDSNIGYLIQFDFL
jgi:hypothetical protein